MGKPSSKDHTLTSISKGKIREEIKCSVNLTEKGQSEHVVYKLGSCSVSLSITEFNRTKKPA